MGFEHFKMASQGGATILKALPCDQIQKLLFIAVGCFCFPPTFLSLIFIVFNAEIYNVPFTNNSLHSKGC